ncbi:MAG: STT3 domain-containing protein [Sulfurovum sp.]|nr:STT3 domain-containing protein [Sulfurovum sp.]
MKVNNTTQIMILIFIAYAVSIAVRLIWVYQFSGNDSFMWDGQLMINTNDGYYFAEGARDILNGTIAYKVDTAGALSIITVYLTKILPFSFETIILYMPAFLGSLLLVPIILIGYSLNRPYLGFIAGLFAAIVWSYYNRTMIGYYDSDMFNIVTPVFVLWSIIHALTTQKNRYLVLMIVIIVASQFWYAKNISLNTAMVFMAVVYVLVKDRNNIFNLKLITFALIGLALIPVYLKAILALVLFGLFHYKDKLTHKYIYPLAGFMFVLYLYSGAFYSILSSLNLYIFNRFFPAEVIQGVSSLQFFDVIGTVREAGAIPFETFANRISGHTITFLFSTIGVILLMVRYPILIISLPMVAMGFMAYKSGLRFTVYAVPIYALGFGYMVLYVREQLKLIILDKKNVKIAQILMPMVMVSLALYPNIMHIIGYKVPTVLNKTEVTDLDKLKAISTPKDYTLAWWDYGYPIRYYSETKTLIDGGKHNNDNFIISQILLSTSPQQVANLSRLAVETYQDANCSVVANTLFHQGKDTQLDPNVFLVELDDSTYILPPKTRDIYLYLPYRMLNIFPTVAKFGNLDLTTGKALRNMKFYPTNAVNNEKGILTLRNGIVFDSQKRRAYYRSTKKES